jgi:hypothetical protein
MVLDSLNEIATAARITIAKIIKLFFMTTEFLVKHFS